jgi:hypothetical protein
MDADMTREVLVLANEDVTEAMRVAAGLTIFGHRVELVFVDRIVEETEANIEQAELLELCEIEPSSLVDDPNVRKLDVAGFSRLLQNSRFVINI